MTRLEFKNNSCRSEFLRRENNLKANIQSMEIQKNSGLKPNIAWLSFMTGSLEFRLNVDQTYSEGEKFITKRIV